MMFYLIVLHVLGACVWTGGHLYVALAVLPRAIRERDPELLRTTESTIERLAMPALFVQLMTGIEIARRHAGGFTRLFDVEDPIDHLVVTKLGLLVLTVVLAADVHLRRDRFEGAAWLRFMSWHIVLVTLISVAFVVLGVGFRMGEIFGVA
ncbi:MAG: copper resistance protein CopD [Planctomycetes bacterium]|nr:copper resistance protein CopD [Planctomycetota bacterium]MCB9903971.1 copper resistance protein CopD [Planctomycetota bacterium]